MTPPSPLEAPTEIPPRVAVEPVRKLAYSIRETAEALGLGQSTVERMVRGGIIPSVRVGSRFLVPVVSLEKWLAERVR